MAPALDQSQVVSGSPRAFAFWMNSRWLISLAGNELGEAKLGDVDIPVRTAFIGDSFVLLAAEGDVDRPCGAWLGQSHEERQL